MGTYELSGAPCGLRIIRYFNPADGFEMWPAMVIRPPNGASSNCAPVCRATAFCARPLLSICASGIFPTALRKGTVPSVFVPGGMRISVSSRLPHTGTKFGLLHGGATCQERIARIGTSLGPDVHGCRKPSKLTGRKTAYSRPSFGVLLMSWTVTDVVPRQ